MSIFTIQGKKRMPLEKKLAILTLIKEKKSILFGQFSSTLENSQKHNAWKEVLLKAQSIGAFGADRDWTWVRDSLYGVWKSRSVVNDPT
jgi:Myb/SANT-like DNA-binding protein